ncbi:hypothetical protein [Nitriliruptor alkaliphilus]|uniref:hypothetical protein n=1 Tax=Nitriliruptor alkaliphilus TaxID=427918 RepID=UPI0012EE23A2|nr:hypothetical protein [Nitriliruptor alkaliphilus]
MAGAEPTSATRPVMQARDVVAFGHETGRALSDGRIIGRAEPFAKVFPSSREVKRAVGLVAWAILEDIALDARLDDAGRLVSTTNVRRIAANLGINKDTAAKHLARLRDYGFVLQEEGRQGPSGRWEACRYVLDPSACLERFTHTPPSTSRGRSARRPVADDGATTRCPKDPDTASERADRLLNSAVSEGAGHGGTGRGEVGHNREEAAVGDQQQTVGSDDAVGQLVGLGIAADRARRLVEDHGPDRVRAVVDGAVSREVRRPAGWVIQALAEGWDLGPDRHEDRELVRRRAERRAAETRRHLDELCDDDEAHRDATGWARVLDGVLDDRLLAEAVHAVADRLPSAVQRSAPIVRSHLLALAAQAHLSHPEEPVDAALRRHLRDRAMAPVTTDGHTRLTAAPAGHPRGDAGRLASRIAAVLAHGRSCPPPHQAPIALERTHR